MYLDFAGSPHGGVLKLLPEADKQARIRPVGLVHHTIVGSAAGAYWYFRDSTGTESTFILPKTGVIWELMALDRVSDAQVAGNYWETSGVGYGFLSVETEDDGDPEHDPWTPVQMDSLRWLNDKLGRVFAWARKQTVAPSGSTAKGTGYHSMWLRTQYMTPDGHQPWTLAAWKGCPATPRIGQYKATLLPAYMSGAPAPTPTPPPVPEVLMALSDTEQDELLTRTRHVDNMLSGSNTVGDVNELVAWKGTVDARLAELLAAVKALTPTPPAAG